MTISVMTLCNNLLTQLRYIIPPKDFFDSLGTEIFKEGCALPFCFEHEQDEPSLFALQKGLITVSAFVREHADFEYFKSIFLHIRPNSLRELTDTALLQLKNEDYERAEVFFLAAEGLFPDELSITLNRALLLDERLASIPETHAEYRDMLRNASELYTRVTKEVPADEAQKKVYTAGLLNAGFFFARQKQYARAESLLEQYLKTASDESETTLLRKRKARQLIHAIRKSGASDLRFTRAMQAINADDTQTALENIHEFLKDNPESWNGWFVLGWALRLSQRWQHAYEALQKSLELANQEQASTDEFESAFVDIYNELAICAMELNKPEAAQGFLYKALEKDCENIKVISNLGVLAMKENRNDEAIGFFKTILEINPDDEFARMLLHKLRFF